jgi:hypothetical protein
MAGTGPRRRKIIGHRRRVEDDGEDDGGPEALDLLDDDSLTEGSIGSDENGAAEDSDTSNVDEVSPTSPNAKRPEGSGDVKSGNGLQLECIAGMNNGARAIHDTDIMLNGLSIAEGAAPVQEMNFDDIGESPTRPAAPIVVSSSSAQPPATGHERRRREHEEYRRKRDEDPSFVPNRGAFFMHDHRHAGPSANGFRPFARGARGRGRGGIGGPFAPMK